MVWAAGGHRALTPDGACYDRLMSRSGMSDKAALVMLTGAILAACVRVGPWPPQTALFAGIAAEQDSNAVRAILLERLQADHPIGSPDRELVTALKEQGFSVRRLHVAGNVSNPYRGRAEQNLRSPAGVRMLVRVSWRADASERISEMSVWYGGEFGWLP